MQLVRFPAHAASILFLSIFRHKIGVRKSPALFQGKELQVTRFQGHVLLESFLFDFYFKTVRSHPATGQFARIVQSEQDGIIAKNVRDLPRTTPIYGRSARSPAP